MDNEEWKSHIVELARRWIGTPYKHQSSVLGHGCDCIGLVRGVWRDLYDVNTDPEVIPPYQPNWYEVDQRDPLLSIGRRHLLEVTFDERDLGDVLVFRMREGASAKHCGIITDVERMVHAYTGKQVYEVSLGPHWHRKVAAVLRFPAIS